MSFLLGTFQLSVHVTLIPTLYMYVSQVYVFVCYVRMFVQALDGFLLVLSSDGVVIYTSESIHHHLGLFQVSTGQTAPTWEGPVVAARINKTAALVCTPLVYMLKVLILSCTTLLVRNG